MNNQPILSSEPSEVVDQQQLNETSTEYPAPVKTSPLENLEAMARSLEIDVNLRPIEAVREGEYRRSSRGSSIATETISPLALQMPGVQPNEGLVEAGASPLQTNAPLPPPTTLNSSRKMASLASSTDSLGAMDELLMPLPTVGAACMLQQSPTVLYSMSASDYRLGPAIGYGSSAVVYQATYMPTNTVVAVKMIELEHFERDQIDELRREIQVMSLCKHPNLLKVLVSFVHASKLWIVTPYLAAGSCLDIMRADARFREGLEEGVLATILVQALRGLVYLHRSGHIHRDFKAGNLLMDTDGTVQLADFGVTATLGWGLMMGEVDSSLAPSSTNSETATTTATVTSPGKSERSKVRKTFVGTPCWMAPEVMEMTRGYDQRADIWSFGITALELAYGHAPFSRYPPMKIIYKTLGEPPPTLDRKHTHHRYSRALKELIDECLKKDPKERPSAEQLLRHPFFKVAARKKSYLITEVLDKVPPLLERPRVQKLARRISASTDHSIVGQEECNEGDSGEHGLNSRDNHNNSEDWDFGSDIDDDKRDRDEEISRDESLVGSHLEEEEGEEEEHREDNNEKSSNGNKIRAIRSSRFVVEAGPDSSHGDSTVDLRREKGGREDNQDNDDDDDKPIEEKMGNSLLNSTEEIYKVPSSRRLSQSAISRTLDHEENPASPAINTIASSSVIISPMTTSPAVEATIEEEGIKKGRFSVLESAGDCGSVGASTNIGNSEPNENFAIGEVGEEEEEGRQSRFQIVEAALDNFTAAAAAATAVLEKERDRLASSRKESPYQSMPSRFRISQECDNEPYYHDTDKEGDYEKVGQTIIESNPIPESLMDETSFAGIEGDLLNVVDKPTTIQLQSSHLDQMLITLDVLRAQVVDMRQALTHQQERRNLTESSMAAATAVPQSLTPGDTSYMTNVTQFAPGTQPPIPAAGYAPLTWSLAPPQPLAASIPPLSYSNSGPNSALVSSVMPPTFSTPLPTSLSGTQQISQLPMPLQSQPQSQPQFQYLLPQAATAATAATSLSMPPPTSCFPPQPTYWEGGGPIHSHPEDASSGLAMNLSATFSPSPTTTTAPTMPIVPSSSSLPPTQVGPPPIPNSLNYGGIMRSYSTDQSSSLTATTNIGPFNGMPVNVHLQTQQPHHRHHHAPSFHQIGPSTATTTSTVPPHVQPTQQQQQQQQQQVYSHASPPYQHRYMNSIGSPPPLIGNGDVPTDAVLLMKRELELLRRENLELRGKQISSSSSATAINPAPNAVGAVSSTTTGTTTPTLSFPQQAHPSGFQM